MVERRDITGLVLAGGQGARMGGLEKGLQGFGGVPLARHAAQRLAPQVGPLLLNANRHLGLYAAFGWPVHADTLPDYPGPLAGLLTGLTHCTTPWLATVPCDSPAFPRDLVARLAQAACDAHAQVAVACAPDAEGRMRRQPVFSLVQSALRADLAAFLAQDGRKIGAWLARHACIEVPFDDADAFANANTLDELRALERAQVQQQRPMRAP
ncbi:molybdenum cofactor guanylyltransferase MobA [Pseudorhodoferax sp. Leaf267]|uniref:molybdenum cofactor guanylyltransferase MobA n=1 Tax=Pseudorhodoferax sp. Leaf267 TaxID=1736316 RepID=UPI0006F95600|nr:molybdenum cofactor guanylyltransferase MobA [Pseudorhodoferax sp. Leaf267]KQP14933.1 molybdenum cofactor guanylyltransferase [Pseudorhodoferax sp. Leaf267]